MINVSNTLYEFDPVQAVYHKNNSQNNIEASKEFGDLIRFEERKKFYLNCDLVLTEYNGRKWNLLTGLQSIKVYPGYSLGDKLLGQNNKRDMLLVYKNGLTGTLILYRFHNYYPKTMDQRIKAAKDFISFIKKK